MTTAAANKTSAPKADLIARATELGIEFSPKWPADAIAGMIKAEEQARAKIAQAEEQAKKNNNKTPARTPREAFEAKARGKLADIYARFIDDPRWVEKIDKEKASGTELTCGSNGTKFLAVLYKRGMLAPEMVQAIETAFPHEVRNIKTVDRVEAHRALMQKMINETK